MTTTAETSGTKMATRTKVLLVAAALFLLVGVIVAAVLISGREEAPAKPMPDYAAVTRDLVSIMFPGSVASADQIEELIPSTKASTDTACDNLAHMPREEVVRYTSISVGNTEKADAFVASMERYVCSRK